MFTTRRAHGRGLQEKSLFSLALAIATSWTFGSAHAQVRLLLRAEHPVVLQYEPLYLLLTVRNEADIPLETAAVAELRPEFEWTVERGSGEPAPRLRDGAPLGPLRIFPEEERRFLVELTRWYDLERLGRYRIRVLCRWREQEYASPSVLVDVVPGIELARERKAVFGYPERMRAYSLRYWTRGGSEVLFLRVEEELTGMIYGVFQLGPLVRVMRPQIEADRLGNVVVTHQSSADCYTRSEFKSLRDRVEFVSQRHFLEDGSPYPTLVPR